MLLVVLPEDLTVEWEPFNPIDGTPTFEELKAIVAEVGKMHAEFYKSEEAYSEPFSKTGGRVHLWDFEPGQENYHEYKDFFFVEMPKLVRQPVFI